MESLALLDRIDDAGVGGTEWLEERGEHELGHFLGLLTSASLPATRARANEQLGRWSSAFDARLEQLWAAPEHFDDFGPLLLSASRSERLPDLVSLAETLTLLSRQGRRAASDHLLDGLGAPLVTAEPGRLDDDELRLLAITSLRGKPPGASPHTVHLVERLLVRSPEKAAERKRLDEIEALLGEEPPPEGVLWERRWYELRAELYRREGRHVRAYEALTASWNPLGDGEAKATTVIQLAAVAHRLSELERLVQVLEPTNRSTTRRKREILEQIASLRTGDEQEPERR